VELLEPLFLEWIAPGESGRSAAEETPSAMLAEEGVAEHRRVGARSSRENGIENRKRDAGRIKRQ
jgi:hypothetical protein